MVEKPSPFGEDFINLAVLFVRLSDLLSLQCFQSRGQTLPLALTGHRLLQDRLFFGCDQYAAGSEKVRFPALSSEIFEMSGANMIRPKHGGEAIEGASPPELKGNWIKIRVKHTTVCFYQIDHSLFDRHS